MNRYPCPCCGYLTYHTPPTGQFDICPVCFWEDNTVQSKEPDFDGGANDMSLNEARENFKKFGAKSIDAQKHVRPPFPEEIPRNP